MSALDAAIRALRRGLVVGLPTDTVYGIGADPWQEAAVAALFALKGRPEVKPIPILAAEAGAVAGLAVLDGEALDAARRHWPGPLTLVVPRAPGLPSWLGDPSDDTIAVRVPAHPVALELLRRWGPLAVTSANRSGEAPAVDDRAAADVLGGGVAVYLPGVAGGGEASTVVHAVGPRLRIVRPGPIAEEDV